MDFVKKAADKIGGGSSDKKDAGKSGDGQDYLDKGWQAASKQAGHDFDPKTDEKITDGARGIYEKATGSKVDPKISN